ncbi:MAG TPA: radical SAM protein [Deltaproteobacteria bacterium]|nr:radical SAM protein [Deltaproteobacteria bacterium]
MDRFSPYKVLHNLDSVKRSIEDPATPPLHVQLDLSENCNHNCIFCFFREDAFNTGMRRKNIAKGVGRRSLKTDKLLTTISELGKLGTMAITLVGGGEPMMHPHAERVLKAIITAGIAYGLITNGSIRMNPIMLESLKAATWIRVSLDAATETTYARMHQPKNPKKDNFQRTITNLKRLREQCPDTDIGVSFLIHPYNYKEIAHCAALCKGIGLNYIQYKPVYTEERGEDVIPFLPEIKSQIVRAQGLETHDFQVIALLARLDDISKPARDYQYCRIHLLNTQIGVDGKVYPCCVLKYVEEYSFGSIYEQSFEEIWSGDQRRMVIERINPSTCPPCWYDRTNEVLEYLASPHDRHETFV